MRSRFANMPSRLLLHVLFVLALLAQGLLPVGWMPALAADGVRVVPCSSYWPEEFAAAAGPSVSAEASQAHRTHKAEDPHDGYRAAPPHHDGGAEGEERQSTSTCAFAGSWSLEPPLATPSLFSDFPLLQLARKPERQSFAYRALAAPPPPPTGPPATS